MNFVTEEETTKKMIRIPVLLFNTISIASALLALCTSSSPVPVRTTPTSTHWPTQPPKNEENLGSATQLATQASKTEVFRGSATEEEEDGGDIYIPLVGGTGVPDPGNDDGSWPMAGGNQARTSWTPEEVRGKLKPLWFRPIEPYILQRTQIIASYGNLYISTSRGLYALDAQTGAEKWVYPTELPLGHSPTIAEGVAYVGGFDHQLHAVNALTGARLWGFTAGAGFDTNPLVADGKVYAGNRDGYFYAIDSSSGQQAWKYKTGGPIHYSAAYRDGVVYFASDDSYAYALDARTGSLVWKSAKLPGAGFHSWWPVVHKDVVIFSGSSNYRFGIKPGAGPLHDLDLNDVYPNHEQDPRGSPVALVGETPGDWVSGTPTMDASESNANGTTIPITEYFETKPWRRTYFVLNRATGEEVTYDFDGDGKKEYAPILWFGTRSGNRYPPVVGSDGVLYQSNNLWSDGTIAGGQISGWGIGTPYISVANSGWNAVDEPVAYLAGGDLIYWSRCCDRIAGAFDISIPEVIVLDRSPGFKARIAQPEIERSWNYFNYNLTEVMPGYNILTYVDPDKYYSPFGGVYGGWNGYYGFVGDVNPPVPYQGKVFMHRGNSILAFSPDAGPVQALPTAEIVYVENTGIPTPSTAELQGLLEAEVEKILAAGHLRPGFTGTGIFDLSAVRTCGDNLLDYWHFPGDTIDTLIRALPYLSADLQQKTKTYLQSEFEKYPPYSINHIGWKDGAAREAFTLPPEVEEERLSLNPEVRADGFAGWGLAPHAFYATWKYAVVFGEAKDLFDASKDKLEAPPEDSVLEEMPHVLNAYIAGYWGYLELEKMAGYAESASVRSELNRLLDLRSTNFSKDAPQKYYEGIQLQNCRSLNVARNFMYLTPELAQYLRENALAKVEEAVTEYERVAPYWFVSKAETAFGEGVINHFYDYHALFQAKALILEAPRSEMIKYLDVPAVPVGDLFYLQNLVALLEAQ